MLHETLQSVARNTELGLNAGQELVGWLIEQYNSGRPSLEKEWNRIS